MNTQKVVSTTSEVSRIGENTLKSGINGKMGKNVSSDDKVRGKASKDNRRDNSSENPTNGMKQREESPEIVPPQIKLLEVTYGTVEINWHKKFQRISFERIKYQRSSHMPYALDPRRVKQLWRECAEEVLTKSPVLMDDNDNDVFISKLILQKIKEDKLLSQDKGTLDQDNCPKSPEILVDNGDNICTVDASSSDSVGEDVVSSTDCGEPGERCSTEEGIADGEIDSSSSTPSNCSEDLPDSSLDPKTVKSILEIPELLDSLDPKIVKNILEIPEFLDSLELKRAKNIAKIPELSDLLEPETADNIAKIPEFLDPLEPKTADNIAKIPEFLDSLDPKTVKNIAGIPELPDSLDSKTVKNIAEIPELPDSLDPKTVENISKIPELPDSLNPKTVKNIREIPELLDSLDPEAVKSILKIPELLDENRGASHSCFVVRKDIKFNSLKGRQIEEPQEIADKGVSSEETSAKSNEEIVMGLTSSVEEMKDSPVRKESPKSGTSNSPQSNSNDNPIMESSISASPISSHDKSSKIKSGEMSEVFDKTKPSEKGENSSLLEKMKKRKEQSSDSSNVKGNEVQKSGKSSSKDRSSEPDAKKKKKSTPEEELKETMKKKESSNIEKSHKDKESHRKHESSSSSSATASKKRESSGSRSDSQEPHRKKHRTSESSSHSGQTPEKIPSKVKPKDASLERIKTEEPSTPPSVNDSKEDAKKKPTPVGSSKTGKRVSRLSLEGDSGTSVTSVTSVTEKIKETLDRIKVKDKPVTDPKKLTSSVNESALRRKTIGEVLRLSNDCAGKKAERPPQKDEIEEKPEKKCAEELKKESHDHSKSQKNAESVGKEAAKQKAPEKSSTPSGAHVPGDYLGRKLLKIARDEREKEKRILADVPKPASAVQRKKKVSIPQIKTPAAPPAADILAINASVPIDVHLFDNIDKEPLPPAPPVIPNKVFPHVLSENPPEKNDKIPLICETSIPLNNLMDVDSLVQEDYDETCSLNSVETVILELSPKEPELEKSPVKEDHKDSNELSSLEEKITHWKRQQLEFERIIEELQLIETSQIKGDTSIDQKPINNNQDNNLVKLAVKDPQNFESKPLNQVVTPAELERIEKKPQIHVPVKSQPIMPFILMQVMLPEPPNQLQKEEKEITMLYEDVIDLIQVAKHHRQKRETMSVLEFQTRVNSLCKTFKKFFDILKNKENVITDEEMIQLIVEHSLHLSSPWHVKAIDISWLLTNSPMRPLAPVPPPISKMNEHNKNMLNVHNKNTINNQLEAEQRHQQHQRHHPHVPKNEVSPTNAAANPSGNLHLPNNQVPNSERVVPNQGLYSTNGHRPIVPRPMPNLNYQGPDQKREVPQTQNEMLRMNVNIQQQQQQRPPLPDQPFPRAPPPPPPPPPSQQQQQSAPQPQNAYQQLNYNNQYQQFPQNEQLVPQQMLYISSCAPNYPQQYAPYAGPSYLNQYQYTPGQPAPNMIQQFPPQQHIPSSLNQGSYPVPSLPMETVQRVNAIIPPELHLCYSGRCDHVNCEKYLKFQEYLRQVKMDPARYGQIPPQTVPSQFVGPQAQSNRDPRWRGAQGSQMQMQSQVPQQHVAPPQVLQSRASQPHISQRQVLQPHVSQPQVSQSQVPSSRVLQSQISQRQVLQQNGTPPQVLQSQVSSSRIFQPQKSQRQVLQQNGTLPQVPQSQVPLSQISQPYLSQQQVLQQRSTPSQVPQSQVSSSQISQPQKSQRQVLQQNSTLPQVPQSQVPLSQISQQQVLQQRSTPPQVPQSQVSSSRISQPQKSQRQVLQQNGTPAQVPQSQVLSTHIPQQQVLQQRSTPPQVPHSQVPSKRISQPHLSQQQVLQQRSTPPQIPQSQVPSMRIPQPHLSQQQVLQQRSTPPQVPQSQVSSSQVPQSQVPSTRIPQSHLSQQQVLQQRSTPPQVPQLQVSLPRVLQPQVSLPRIPQPHISQSNISQQKQVPQPQVTPPQVPQSQISRQSPIQKAPAHDPIMMTPRIQSNLAALQHLNQSLQSPQHIQNQGPPPKYRDIFRPNLQYPPRLPMPPMSHPASSVPVGSQTSDPQIRENLENTLNRKSPQTSMVHPPKIPTPGETCPKIRSPVGKLLKEMLSTPTAPVPIAVLTPKNSPKPSASPNNTPKPPRNISPLNLASDKNLETPESPKVHLNVEDEDTERPISPKKVRQKRTIDVITVSSSEDEEESEFQPEPKRLNKSPEYSRVDDEIECVGIAKELGIKLDSTSSSEIISSEDSDNFPVIGAVMTIPMTDFEKMNIIMEKEEDQMDFKDEVPMEIQEEAPMEENTEQVLCITCKEKAAVAYCRKCDRELFCSEACAEKSAHFASCILVVKIEDD